MVKRGTIQVCPLKRFRKADGLAEEIHDTAEGFHNTLVVANDLVAENVSANTLLSNAEHNEFVKRAFDFGPGTSIPRLKVDKSSMVYPEEVPNFPIYCLTKNSAPLFFGRSNDACVEIADTNAFVERVHRAMSEADPRMTQHLFGACEYSDEPLAFQDSRGPRRAFVKRTNKANEEEYRIVWPSVWPSETCRVLRVPSIVELVRRIR